jgi:CRISPR-associated endonuclease Csn1
LCFGDIFKNKKGEELKISQSSIFWQRPLRSQKGTVGKCTLEPSKYRCPTSHPAFEEFRAWSFLNNIKYKVKGEKEAVWKSLDLETKKELYNEKFTGRLKPNFDFYEIYLWLKKKNQHDNWDLNYNFKTNVAACPVSAQLRAVFGDDWENLKIAHTANEKRNTKKDYYDIYDIWHIPFSSDDEDFVKDFAANKLQLDEAQTKKYLSLWKSMPIDYGQLSLKAINNILRFLRKGLIYTEATLLAKIPEVLKEELWSKNEHLLVTSISSVIEDNRKTKKQLGVVNSLIAQYKAQPNTEKFAERNFEYKLDASDASAILNAIEETYGKITWNEKPEEEKQRTIQFITSQYQSFFNDPKRQFKKMPHLLDSMKQFLEDNFELPSGQLKKLYHPSQIEVYPSAKRQTVKDKDLLLLGSPKTGAFKNPMAMRALHELRKLVNYLITTDQIDEQTRIVVELARELNDANKRWAYEKYQQTRKEENAEFAAAIRELIKDSDAQGISVNPDNAEDIDKFRLWYDMMQGEDAKIGIEKGGTFIENTTVSKTKKNKGSDEEYEVFAENNFEKLNKSLYFRLKRAGEDVVNKYKLWKQQNCQCIYTGKSISITQLFQDNLIDFEHTIPRSQSFDNSMENLTVCYADYNRKIKKNQIPFDLPNYEEESNGYSAIKPRLEKWEQKVEDLEKHIEYWKAKSKRATTKDDKDKAIRQKHLWQFELDYWRGKLYRFTMEEVKSGFRNSQLVDTQIISKYASHYLKTVFSKVEVQKGTVTSDFRKIFGIQLLDERKDRGIHSHHAKDAIVLSVIPATALREQILKVWNELEEHRDSLKGDEASMRGETINRIDFLERELNKLLNECNLPNVNGAIDKLDGEIIINNRTSDQILSPAKKRIRSRGKVMAVNDKSGNPVYRTDKNGEPMQLHIKSKPVFKNNEFGRPLLDESGNRIPVFVPKEKWAKGSNIRGQLHLDTFYGKIRPAKWDEDGRPLRDENGDFIYSEKNEGFRFVLRKEINNDFDVESIVDPHLKKMIFNQLNGRSVDKTLKEDGGLWMLDRNGNRVNKIRHVRCFADDVTNPLAIKRQTNLSNKDYKNDYWAKSGENYICAIYQNVKKDKNGNYVKKDGKEEVEREIEIINLMDIALRRKSINGNDLGIYRKDKHGLEILRTDGTKEPPFANLKKGIKVIFYKENIEELKELQQSELNKRIYKVKKFAGGQVTFDYHLEAREDPELTKSFAPKDFFKIDEKGKEVTYGGRGKSGFTENFFDYEKLNYGNPWHRLRYSKDYFNFAIEGKHFEVKPDGKVEWSF